MKLIITNLASDVKQEDVVALFAQVGTVISCALNTDKKLKICRGYGFVEMSDEDGANAIQQLNNTNFQDRIIRVAEQA